MKTLNKFIFLIVNHEVDKSLLIKITSQYFSLRFDLHEIILNHLLLLQELTSFTDFDKLFISLSIFNYSLLKLNIPTLKFSSKNLQEYEELKKDYFLKKNKKIFAYLSNLINNPCQNKSYYQNLKPITLTNLKNQLLKNNKLGYFISSMLAGIYVGMAIMLIFTIGGFTIVSVSEEFLKPICNLEIVVFPPICK